MVQKLKLDELPIKMSDVTVRFSAVNPANENISAGIFTMDTVMHVVDYKGKMLDENGNWLTQDNVPVINITEKSALF